MERLLDDEAIRRGCNLRFTGWIPDQDRTLIRARLLCTTHWIECEDELPEDSVQPIKDNHEKGMYTSLFIFEDEGEIIE